MINIIFFMSLEYELKLIKLILVSSILIMTVSFSGCVDNTEGFNQTFSEEGLVFNYPSSYSQVVQEQNRPGDIEGTQIIGTLINNNTLTSIIVRKIPLNTSNTLDSRANEVRTQLMDNFDLLGDTKNTLNGIVFYEFVYLDNRTQSNNIKGVYLVFGENRNVGYSMNMITSAENFDSQNVIFQKIKGTIRII